MSDEQLLAEEEKVQEMLALQKLDQQAIEEVQSFAERKAMQLIIFFQSKAAAIVDKYLSRLGDPKVVREASASTAVKVVRSMLEISQTLAGKPTVISRSESVPVQVAQIVEVIKNDDQARAKLADVARSAIDCISAGGPGVFRVCGLGTESGGAPQDMVEGSCGPE